jgi:phage tail sheath protein FI
VIAGGRLGAGVLSADDEAVTSGYAYRTPGVHIEFPRARRAIAPRRTDITGFVGIASRGPVLTPIRVESWSEFAAAFGTHTPSGYLAYAVEAYFAAGGHTAWVVRVAHPATARPASLPLPSDDGSPALLLAAAWGATGTGTALPSPGAWANRMTATITRDGARFDLTLRSPDGLTEQWRGLSTSEGGDRPAPTILNDAVTGSRLVTARLQPGLDPQPPAPGGPFAFSGGADGLAQLGIGDLLAGIRLLEPIDEIAILAAPDLQEVPRVDVVNDSPPLDCSSPPVDAPPVPEPDPPEFPAPFDPLQLALGVSELIAQCERTRDRFAILDPPRRARDPAQAATFKDGLVPSAYAAMYFPWVAAPDPLRLGGDLVRIVPPSGHIAGVYAATDRAVGVHKPPANVALELAVDVAFQVDDVTHGDANHTCLNIVRPYGGRGIRVAGARTLACRAPWRFVNVRRLVAMIEEAIEEDLAWAVFEASNEVLWAEVDRQVRGFLDDLWRAGMLDGRTAEEAFDVRCDAETNPPDQVDLGRLTCLIALRPPAPAEFVVVRVTLSAEGAEAATMGAVDA